MKRIYAILLLLSISINVALAHLSTPESVLQHKNNVGFAFKTLASDCFPSSTQTELNVNSVRANIFNQGDMWWDLQGLPKYEIPKGGGKHSLFASALWIGGLDDGNVLKVAAMTYRQNGIDFWPGPLGTSTSKSEVDKATCEKYNFLYKVTRDEVDKYVNDDGGFNPANLTPSIQNWPGSIADGLNAGEPLAPFISPVGNAVYDPTTDYPAFDLKGTADCKKGNLLYGDQCIFWVFNDKGNVHTESRGQAIGLQINAQAFAFNTNDEINNMTFYNYTIINRSSYTLYKTYFGQWCDPDLGVCTDDYVGCDVKRGLGYCYNGDAIDDNTPSACAGEQGYGANPPAVGIDFFKGPIADPNDGIDNDRDGTIDEVDEEIIMSGFVYYNNDATVRGNPSIASDFYGYLQGNWRDGTAFTYGGNAYQQPGPVCKFMFPGDTDPLGVGTGGLPQPAWSEITENNPVADRRFLQPAGPFTLKPGAVNSITVGAVWARAASGGNLASITSLQLADDKAQNLFDNCFKVLNGPDAPDMTIQELNNEILIALTSTDSIEIYSEKDPLIIASGTIDNTYNFEGYNVFQLKDSTVTASELYDLDKARLVAHCDVKNNISNIINYDFDVTTGSSIGQEKVKLADENENIKYDKGIVHSFKITEDQFASGEKKLINHKKYFYMAITYGYNNFKTYKQDAAPNTSDPTAPASDGQKQPFKQGRKNITRIIAIPHDPAPEAGGTKQKVAYGEGVKLKRIEGQGNGGNVLDYTDETVNEILNSAEGRVLTPEYAQGKGPINIKVIDPLAVPKGQFEIRLTGVRDTSNWILTNLSTSKKYYSSQSIKVGIEELIPELGLSVTVQQLIGNPGDTLSVNNGVLEASITFADPAKNWLSGIADIDGYSPFNWIRSGTQLDRTGNDAQWPFNDFELVYYGTNSRETSSNGKGKTWIDGNEDYEKMASRLWAPYALCGYTDVTVPPSCVAGPGLNLVAGPSNSILMRNTKLYHLASVDIVLTSDKSKWTRCPVLEETEGANKLYPKTLSSVGKDGLPDNTGTGMGWFPGYAINLETGERLNMAFGEDSRNVKDNGNDMIWNPTSKLVGPVYSGSSDNNGDYYVFGGKHYIYVFGHNTTTGVPNYDEGSFIYTSLSTKSRQVNQAVFRDAMWVNLPILKETHTLLESDVKIRLRVAKAYNQGYSTGYYTYKSSTSGVYSPFFSPPSDLASNPQNDNNPMYTFSTDDISAETSNVETAKSALDIINIVPNPYFAYSNYETDQLDTRVKITNLPENCTVTIYSVNGTLIRKFNKGDIKTSLDWDLKNQAGIPIAGGLYLIHIDAPNVGEKIIKWYGAIRPPDLSNY